jgi:hypothetical protein
MHIAGEPTFRYKGHIRYHQEEEHHTVRASGRIRLRDTSAEEDIGIDQTHMSTPSTPKRITWIIGLTAGILGIIGHYVHVQILTEYNYGLLLVGFVVLAAGTTFREL